MNSKKQRANSGSGEDYRLVYSTDPLPQPKESENASALPSSALKPSIRIERKGRNGKTVTIVAKLHPNETFLKDLCAHLKRSLGCGGSYSISDGQGVIELQGDRREQVPALLLSSQKKT